MWKLHRPSCQPGSWPDTSQSSCAAHDPLFPPPACKIKGKVTPEMGGVLPAWFLADTSQSSCAAHDPLFPPPGCKIKGKVTLEMGGVLPAYFLAWQLPLLLWCSQPTFSTTCVSGNIIKGSHSGCCMLYNAFLVWGFEAWYTDKKEKRIFLIF